MATTHRRHLCVSCNLLPSLGVHMKNVRGVPGTGAGVVGGGVGGGPAEHGPEDEQDPMQVTDFIIIKGLGLCHMTSS